MIKSQTHVAYVFPILCLFALNGCVATVSPERFTANQPEFVPEQFFAGVTHGSGVVQSSSGVPSRQFTVLSEGKALPDGRFQLDQTVEQRTPGSDSAVTARRTWIITRVDATRYTATLSDAAGPVTGEIHGNLFHLKYRFANPLVTMEQWLYLQADGRTVLNEGRISFPGIGIARISEIITRDSPSASR
jgi:hypothetical protein